MSAQLISIYGLCAMFVVATILPVNMGVLAFVGAFLIGTLVAGQSTKDIIAGFPAGLFLTLVGITYLFALAQNNGTIDWLVRLAMGFAAQPGIGPMLMGMMVVHGAQAGGFSPISIYGGITNGVVAQAGLPLDPVTTFLASFFVNFAVAGILFFLLGGRQLMSRRAEFAGKPASALAGSAGTMASPIPPIHVTTPQGGPQAYGNAEAESLREDLELTMGDASSVMEVPSTEPETQSRPYQILTVIGLVALAVLTLAFNLDIGFVAITIGLVLSLIAPNLQKRAMGQVSWPEIVLITGVSTYVGVLQAMGTIDFVGNSVAGLASPLMAALLLCFIGAVVSAFASSTAVLGSLIPLAVPFLQGGSGVGAIGFIAAMAVSSTIVDVSPFSTNGALVLANAQGVDRDAFFRQLMAYGAIVTILAPVVVWLLFIVFV